VNKNEKLAVINCTTQHCHAVRTIIQLWQTDTWCHSLHLRGTVPRRCKLGMTCPRSLFSCGTNWRRTRTAFIDWIVL